MITSKNRMIKELAIQYRAPLMLLAGIIISTVYMNYMGKNYEAVRDIFASGYFHKIVNVTVDYGMLFQYILKQRMKELAIIVLCGFTSFSGVMYCGVMIGLGMVFGLLLCSAIMNMGALGIGVTILAIVPQYLCYMMGLYLVTKMRKLTERKIKSTVVLLLMILAITLLGVVLEVYVNPLLMKLIYTNIYVI